MLITSFNIEVITMTKSRNLVIAFRFEDSIEDQYDIDVVDYVKKLKSLNPKEIICSTSLGSPCKKILEKESICIKEYEKFDELINTKVIEDCYTYANNRNLLVASFATDIHEWQLEHGYNFLKSRNLLSVGWRILQQENDGSYIGKLSYNTCLLYRKNFNKYVEECGGIPSYVKNGYLGTLSLKVGKETNEIKIGGQEDLALQMKIYKSYKGKKSKLFGHITHYGINYRRKEKTQSGFNAKIARKVITAEIYRKIEDVNPKDFMDSWQII